MEFFETKYLYLILLLFTISYPLAQSFERRLSFYSKWKKLLFSSLAMMILFIPWDIWFTSSQVWQFNPKYFLGFKLFYLPIEEWLFFLFIPFACIFIYEVLNYFFPTNSSGNFSRIAINGLALILFLFAIFNYQKQYTFVCFLLTSLFIFFLNTRNISWLFKFLRMYLVSLIPFILINGFLTGSFTDQAVVIYNSEEILGFRILNIPIEDSIYNLLMLLVVIFFYER